MCSGTCVHTCNSLPPQKNQIQPKILTYYSYILNILLMHFKSLPVPKQSRADQREDRQEAGCTPDTATLWGTPRLQRSKDLSGVWRQAHLTPLPVLSHRAAQSWPSLQQSQGAAPASWLGFASGVRSRTPRRDCLQLRTPKLATKLLY